MRVVEVEAAEVAVEVAGAVAVVEKRHHPYPEERDMKRLSLHMWTTNYMARVLTSLQETSKRPESLSLSGTSIGVSTLTRQ